LILRKNVKIVATGCHILKLKCSKLQRSPDPLTGLKRAYFLGEGRGRKGPKRRGRKGKDRGKGREREWGGSQHSLAGSTSVERRRWAFISV